MQRSVLGLLVEPQTQSQLAVVATDERDGGVLAGELVAGDRRYPVREGIPSFVPEEMTDVQTVRSFAEKWDKHRYYRTHTERFYTEWFVQRYGFDGLDGLKAFLADKRRILDAGTGSGRDGTNFATLSDALVFGVDTAWPALAHGQAQARGDGTPSNFVRVHADVNRMPFPDGFFDYINCDQVMHHTPDPPATFKNLLAKLRPGGEITSYVYRKKAVIREYVDDYVRERIKDLSFQDAMEVCDGITRLGHAFAKLKTSVEIDADIPVLGITKGTYDVQRFLHWNVLKCFWNDEFDFFTNNVVNVDWYHPVYCFRYTPEEFRAWFEGLDVLAWDEQEAGISCRARKPGPVH